MVKGIREKGVASLPVTAESKKAAFDAMQRDEDATQLLGFGKNKRLSFEQMCRQDWPYAHWCLSNIDSRASPGMVKLCSWLRRFLVLDEVAGLRIRAEFLPPGDIPAYMMPARTPSPAPRSPSTPLRDAPARAVPGAPPASPALQQAMLLEEAARVFCAATRTEIMTAASRVTASLPADHEDILAMMQHIAAIKGSPHGFAEGQNPSGSTSTPQ